MGSSPSGWAYVPLISWKCTAGCRTIEDDDPDASFARGHHVGVHVHVSQPSMAVFTW